MYFLASPSIPRPPLLSAHVKLSSVARGDECVTLAHTYNLRANTGFSSCLLHSMMVVVVVFKVRRVPVDKGVSILVEAVENPKPRQATQSIRPSFVKHAWLMKRQALVCDPRSAAACVSESRKKKEQWE